MTDIDRKIEQGEYNYRALKKQPYEKLLKMYQDAEANRDIYIKRMKENNKHFKKHIKMCDDIISIVCKITLERRKDE